MTKPRVTKLSKHPAEAESARNICFVISPIGRPGTEEHDKFTEVLEFVIKAAVAASGYKLDVIRADEIDRAGSFIKDILAHLYTSHVVIADLTGQNPNVFYELGVRHALSPRTVLIAQSIDDIPSDLREYRTIIYDASAKGAASFSTRLRKYLGEMQSEPERPDNPVLDRIGSIMENKIAHLKAESQQLKGELSKLLQKGTSSPRQETRAYTRTRVDRITKLMGAEQQYLGTFSEGKKNYQLPVDQGKFDLYFVEKGKKITEFWYLAAHASGFDYKDDLADLRVLMKSVAELVDITCTFIIATSEDMSAVRNEMQVAFNRMKERLPAKSRNRFSLKLWDDAGMGEVEKTLGLKVEV